MATVIDLGTIMKYSIFDKDTGNLQVINLQTLAEAVKDTAGKTMQEHVTNAVTDARHLSDADVTNLTATFALLASFNQASKLVMLDASGKIPADLYSQHIQTDFEVATIADRDTGADDFPEGSQIFVVDATGDTTVDGTTTKWAIYRKMSDAYTTANPGVKFIKIMEGESLDIVLPSDHMKLITGGVVGNLPKISTDGQIIDSGIIAEDVLTKVAGAVEGNLPAFDALGKLTDSGVKATPTLLVMTSDETVPASFPDGGLVITIPDNV